MLKNYQISRIIGQGAYGSVRLCLDKQQNKKFAVKIYEKHRLNDVLKRKAAQREITVLKRLDHPGVITLYDFIDTPNNIYIVTDFINGQSIQELTKS